MRCRASPKWSITPAYAAKLKAGVDDRRAVCGRKPKGRDDLEDRDQP
jgi:hypothetical protein